MKLGTNPEIHPERSGLSQRRKRRRRLLLAAVLTVGLYALIQEPAKEERARETVRATKAQLARRLEAGLRGGTYPTSVEIDGEELKVEYSLDTNAQAAVERWLKLYRPDYAAVVALDANTGRILALSSGGQKIHDYGNLALRGTFPAASVFKIVTATAALDLGKADANTIIPFNGGYHTLYRRNVTSKEENRWTRRITLREAFAKSVNTVFAKLGIFVLGPPSIAAYADKFHFNKPIHADVPMEPGRFVLSLDDEWATAEVASGFNRDVTLSPLQAAMMAGAIANRGSLMEPYLVEALLDKSGTPVYFASRNTLGEIMQPDTAYAMRGLMQETITRGTSRSAFRNLKRRKGYQSVEIGGKTGSLSGNNPKGKYDWFVGYASDDDRNIAIAVLTINETLWRVKSSTLANLFVEHYFSPGRSRKLAFVPH